MTAAFLGLGGYSRSARAQSTEVLKIGVPPFVNQSAIFLAQDMGWFAKVGIDLKLQMFPDGSLIVAPLVSGEIDIGVVTCSAGLFNAMSRGAPFRAFLCNGQGKAGRSGSAIAVIPELYDQGVKSAADLAKIKGKTIAVPAAGSINQYGIAVALQTVKLNPVSDVNWQTTVSMPDIVKQMGQKQIEVADISYQLAFLAQKQNICRLIASGDELYLLTPRPRNERRSRQCAGRPEGRHRPLRDGLYPCGPLVQQGSGRSGQISRRFAEHHQVHLRQGRGNPQSHSAPLGMDCRERNAERGSVMAQQDFWNSPFKMVERRSLVSGFSICRSRAKQAAGSIGTNRSTTNSFAGLPRAHERARQATDRPMMQHRNGARSGNAFLQRALPTISFFAFFVAWEAIVRLRGIPPIYLPAPSVIAESRWIMVADGTIPIHLAYTLARIFAGFAAAAVSGVAIGIFMGMSPVFARVLDPWIAALYPLPKISLIPLLIIWLGTGELYKIAISAFSAVFPVVISTYAGIRQIDPDLIKTAVDRGQSASNPTAGGDTGRGAVDLRRSQLGMGIAIILVVAAEMIGGSGQKGMGYLLISSGQIIGDGKEVFACLIVLAFAGAAIIKCKEWLDRRVAPWAAKRDEI